MARKGFSWFTSGSGGFVDARDVAEACIRLVESDVTNMRFVLNAQNMTYQEFGNKLLAFFGHKPAKREVGRIMMGLMWRLEKLFASITGKQPELPKKVLQLHANR